MECAGSVDGDAGCADFDLDFQRTCWRSYGQSVRLLKEFIEIWVMEKRGQGLTINTIVVIVVAVLVLFMLFLLIPKMGFFKNFIDFDFGRGNESVEGVEILRYGVESGEVQYYDGQEWRNFEEDKVRLGKKIVSETELESDFGSYYLGSSRKGKIFAPTGYEVEVERFSGNGAKLIIKDFSGKEVLLIEGNKRFVGRFVEVDESPGIFDSEGNFLGSIEEYEGVDVYDDLVFLREANAYDLVNNRETVLPYSTVKVGDFKHEVFRDGEKTGLFVVVNSIGEPIRLDYKGDKIEYSELGNDDYYQEIVDEFEKWKKSVVGNPIVLSFEVEEGSDLEDRAEVYCPELNTIRDEDYLVVELNKPVPKDTGIGECDAIGGVE